MLGILFLIHSSGGSSEEGGSRGPKFHGSKSDVAIPNTWQATRSDPWLPGSLCSCGKWRVKGPAPNKGCYAG